MSTPRSATRTVSPSVQDLDVGLAEDGEEVAAAGLQVAGHVQVGVHPGLQDRDAAEAVELGGVGVEVEGAGDHHVEAGLGGLARRGDQVGALDGAVFGADEDAGAALRVLALGVAALGADQLAGPGLEGGERDAVALVLLVDAGAAEVLEDGLDVALGLGLAAVAARGGVDLVDQLAVDADGGGAVRRQAFHREGAGDADAFPVLVGLVVEVFVLGAGGDRGVDLLLAGDAGLPEGGEGRAGRPRASRAGPRGGFPIPSGRRRGRARPRGA